jgi:hypothetical protein
MVRYRGRCESVHALRRNAKSNLYQLIVVRNLLNNLIEAAYCNFI